MNMGWICSRCQKSNAPSVLSCGCIAVTQPAIIPINPMPYWPIPIYVEPWQPPNWTQPWQPYFEVTCQS